MHWVRNPAGRFDRSIADLVTTGQTQERLAALSERVSQKIDPFYVGELVREGIENDWAYIFTMSTSRCPGLTSALRPSSKASIGSVTANHDGKSLASSAARRPLIDFNDGRGTYADIRLAIRRAREFAQKDAQGQA
jgi:hypothetical protein